MRRISLALAALAALVAAGAQADVYKTVDAQGQPHYSDQWSPGAELIKGDRSHAPDAPAPAPPANDRTQAPDTSKAAAKQVQADVDAVKAEQCKQLKDQYDKVIHARRIYAAPPAGADSSAPRQYMSDAEADAERVKTRQAMDEACAGSSSG